MKITELLARISADTTNFNSGVDSADRKLKGLSASSDKAGSSVAGLGRSFGSILAVSGIGGIVAGLVDFGSRALDARGRIEGLEKGLTAMMGSAEAAADEMRKLQEVAKQPGLGLEEAAQGAVRLQAAGLAADLSRKAIAGFGNALALVGGGKAQLDGVLLALSQISAKGKVSAEEINQIAERVPQIRQLMKGAFGTADTEELQKMSIGSKVFIEKIVAELDKLPKATGGWTNAMENFGDSWTRMMAGLGKAAQPAVSTALEWFSKLIEGVAVGLSAWDDALAQLDKADSARLGGYKEKLTEATRLAKGFEEISKKLAEQDAKDAQSVSGKGFGFRGLSVAGAPARGDGRIKLNIISQPSALAPDKAALDKWKKAQEDSIKETYGLWDKFQKDMEFLAKRPGLDIDLGATPSRWHEQLADMIRMTDQRKQLDADLADSAAASNRRTIEALDSVHQKAKDTIPVQVTWQQALANQYWETGDASKLALLQQVQSFDELTKAADRFGVVIQSVAATELGLMIKQFKALEDAAMEGKIGMEALSNAYEAIRKKTREVQGDAAPPIVTSSAKRTTDGTGARALREVSTVATDLSRNLTNLAFEGGKFRDVMVSGAEEVGKALTRFVLQEGLMKIGKELFGLAKGVPMLGAAISKIPGFAGAAASSASAIPSIASSIGPNAAGMASGVAGIGGGAASAASSTLSAVTGVIGAVGSIGTMISSIVFGMKAAKDADVANKHSLQLVMQGEAMDTFLRNSINGINDRLNEFRTIGIRVFTTDSPLEVVGAGQMTGGGVTVTQNFGGNQILGVRGMEMLADELVRLIKARW